MAVDTRGLEVKALRHWYLRFTTSTSRNLLTTMDTCSCPDKRAGTQILIKAMKIDDRHPFLWVLHCNILNGSRCLGHGYGLHKYSLGRIRVIKFLESISSERFLPSGIANEIDVSSHRVHCTRSKGVSRLLLCHSRSCYRK